MKEIMEWLRVVQLPPQGNRYAAQVDDVYMIIWWISAAFFVMISGAIFYFVMKYRRRREGETTPHLSHHTGLEVLWTVLPTLIAIGIFVIGFIPYMDGQVAPGDAMEIQVIAKKWVWEFEYPNGIRTLNEIHVPAGKAVRLVMSSQDVLHSFFIPSMRVKQDVLPNRYTTVWFDAEQLGQHTVFCTEYCGRGHSDMVAKISVDDARTYQDWLETGGLDENMPLSELGAILYKTRGCETCHSLDGSRRDGPSFKDLYGKTERMNDGTMIQVDENYVRESILVPGARVVATFEPIMPTFQGLLRERELNALVAFIKTQSSLTPQEELDALEPKPEGAPEGGAQPNQTGQSQPGAE
jgi:cytochrome c oxidase subunit II